MAINIQPARDMAAGLRRSIHAHWRAFMAEGVLLVVLGFAAIALPLFAGLTTAILLGWVLLVAGLVGLVATMRTRGAGAFTWSLLSACVALAAGVVLLINPLVGLVTLTYVLIAYFVADGVFSVARALSHRRELAGRWEWMLVSGLVDFVLAAVIISGLPGSFLWVVGMLVGIDLVIGGVSLIGMASASRRTA